MLPIEFQRKHPIVHSLVTLACRASNRIRVGESLQRLGGRLPEDRQQPGRGEQFDIVALGDHLF